MVRFPLLQGHFLPIREESVMEGEKKWYASRGIWGSLIGMATGIISFYSGMKGYIADHPTDIITIQNSAKAIYENGSSIIIIVSAFIGWVGRWKATETISKDKI
jgi:hypothetical protein